jgi:hypothetical protein
MNLKIPLVIKFIVPKNAGSYQPKKKYQKDIQSIEEKTGLVKKESVVEGAALK